MRYKIEHGIIEYNRIREDNERLIEEMISLGGGSLVELSKLKRMLRFFSQYPHQFNSLIRTIRRKRVKYYVFIYRRKKRVFVDLKDFMEKVVYNEWKPRKKKSSKKKDEY